MSKKRDTNLQITEKSTKKSSENTISPTYFKIIFYKIVRNDNNWSIRSASNYPFPPRPINFNEYLTVLVCFRIVLPFGTGYVVRRDQSCPIDFLTPDIFLA